MTWHSRYGINTTFTGRTPASGFMLAPLFYKTERYPDIISREASDDEKGKSRVFNQTTKTLS
jgi:hypothetical protein